MNATHLILILLLVVVISYAFLRIRSQNKNAEILELREGDFEKAKQQASLQAEIDSTQKELKEVEEATKGMTPEQIENYWKDKK